MKTLPIEGTLTEVSFYEDDTIERVRELIAISQSSHPDRLFLQVRVTLPEGHYATPKEWTGLFFRLSRDGATVTEEDLRTYLAQVRSGVSDFPVHAYTREEWEEVDPKAAIRDGGQEWHILGAKTQTVLPLPPKDMALPTSVIPLLSLQSLVETVHPFPLSELRVTLPPDAPSDAILRAYFPRLQPKVTPVNLDASKDAILAEHARLGKLLALPVKRHRSAMLTKAKWYVSLNATKIPRARSTFEQIFYGLTLSKETPFIGYYLSGETTLRSKFYVSDPKTKIPLLDPALVKAWYDVTAPNRRRPTLLLYRGTSRSVFQRIAITSLDITLDIRKDKASTKSLDDLKVEARDWLLSLDAVVPFLDARDLALDRWQLGDMSLTATYAKEETRFDMLRFDCLRSLFGEEGGTFRMLRVDQGKVPRRVLDACQALSQDDVSPTPESLANALGTSVAEAKALLDPILSGDVDCERALRDFPIIRFARNEVEIDFATNPERMLTYVDILRYVLTTDAPAVNEVCPRRQESVPALSIIPQNLPADEDEDDEEGFDISSLTVTGANAAAPPPPPPPAPKKGRMLQVAKEKENTQNYFNTQLQAFNPTLFAPPYSRECEKNNQVVVLTPEAKEAIRAEKGDRYTYEDAAAGESLDIPGGTAICPPYWCMTDLIPLREEDLETDAEGIQHCPICKGKVRPNDKVSTREYPVIKRQTSKGQTNRYPRFMRKREGVPCCYPSAAKDIADTTHRVDENYILGETLYDLPPERAGRLSDDLATRMGLTTSYDTTIVNKRLDFDTEDVFRIGLGGQPRDVLPKLLGKETAPLPEPKDRPDVLSQCSFFATTGKIDAVEELNRRWTEKTMDPLDQIEYMSFFLDYSVILVAADRNKVLCGFRTEGILSGKAGSKTIVILTRTGKLPEVLGSLRRKKKKVRVDQDVASSINLLDGKLATMNTRLLQAHQDACLGDMPREPDAWSALDELGVNDRLGVVDAYGRLQFYFVKGVVLIPLLPVPTKLARYTPNAFLRLHEIPEGDLPTYDSQVASLNALKREALFRHEPSKNHQNDKGEVVEVETVTGFRIPVRPMAAAPGPTTEVLQTVRATPAGEETLLSARPDPEGPTLKERIDYGAELYEFLLFSLANDIAVDQSGETRTDYPALRDAIVARSPTALTAELAAWFKAESYKQKTATPYTFLSKVRTPCGQLKEEACASSSLCGWVKKDKVCKIQVRSTLVDTDMLLKRLRQTLLENDKQRALVLDTRLSRFFSTQLYQELPHELITTV